MKKTILSLLLSVTTLVGAWADNFTNPVMRKSLPDPTVVRGDDGYFYCFATEDIHNVPILRSSNLVDWQLFRSAFREDNRPDFVTDAGTGIWAPDINKVGDKYVLYFAMSAWGGGNTCGIGVASSDCVTGPYTNHKKLFISNEIGVNNSIDPNYVEDGDKKYLIWGSFNGIYMIELSDDGMSLKDGAQKKKIANKTVEAPYIVKHGEYYYLIASAGSCCDGANSTYKLVVARAENVTGPYKNKAGKDVSTDSWLSSLSPQLDNLLTADKTNTVGPGHNARIMTDDNGTDWILYHCFDAKDIDAGRQLFLSKVTWGNDGWPTIDNGNPYMEAERPVFNAIPASTIEAKLTKVGGVYQLSSAEDVENFSRLVNDYNGYANAKAVLTQDIDYSGTVHVPIGTDARRYRGTFDGQGHRIKNLVTYAWLDEVKEQGLFSVCEGGAVIKNVIMDKSCETFTRGVCASSLIGCCNGHGYGSTITIENCGNEANITGNQQNNSAFLGCNYDGSLKIVIKNCYNTGNISGGWENGVFSGWLGNSGSTITNSWNTGVVKNGIDGKSTLARCIEDGNFKNTYDLANQPSDKISTTILSGYDPSWLTSGKLCTLMNKGTTAWKQALGTDEHPVPVGTNTVYEASSNGSSFYLNENGTIASLTFNEGKAFTSPVDFNVTNVTLQRVLKQGTWNTFCVPFDMTIAEVKEKYGNNTEVKELTNLLVNGEQYILGFDDATSVEAGKAYLVNAETTVSSITLADRHVKHAVEPVEVSQGGNSVVFNGVYSTGLAPQGSFIIKDNGFYLVNSDVTLKGYRAYLTANGSTSAKTVTFSFDDITAVDTIDAGTMPAVIYNLNGVKMNTQNLPKGVYVVNGKKVVIK